MGNLPEDTLLVFDVEDQSGFWGGNKLVVATEVKPFREKVKGKWIFRLHSAQQKVWDSTKRFVFFLAGTKSGKTCLGPHWLHREIQICGSGDYLAVTATYDLFKLKMLPELLLVFVDILKCGYYWTGDQIIELSENLEQGKFWQGKGGNPHGRMWGRIILRSAKAEKGLESGDALAAWLDEIGQPEFSLAAWEAVQRRLSLASENHGRVLGTTTLYTVGWLKREIYDRWRDGSPDIDIIQADSTVNPIFTQKEFDRVRDLLPPWKFNMFYRGQYDNPVGLIYDSFDQAVCRIKRFPIPQEWPRYIGHDFGSANPAAMFYAYNRSENKLFAYAEYLPGSGKSALQHIDAWRDMTRDVVVMDKVGGSHTEQGWRDSYSQQGWVIREPDIKPVDLGIDKVYALHKHNMIYAFDDLLSYLDEKDSYSWKLNDLHQPTNEIADKSRFHLMDAERYILSGFSPDSGEAPMRVALKRYY